MAKEFIYQSVKELGNLGKDTLEIGNFTVDGKQGGNKVYRISTYTKQGTEQVKRNAICSESEVKELIELLKGV